MKEPRNLRASRVYQALEWPVFPVHSGVGGRCSCGDPNCQSPGKHPLTAHGFLDATTDLQQIESWWKQSPWASVAIPTGEISGLIVLDVDPRNGGRETLAKLVAEHGPLPDTIVCLTGGGGEHYYFKHPGGHLPRAKPWQGIEVQSDGGYVIAPLSVHIQGEQYLWKKDHEPKTAMLAEPPEWILEALRKKGSNGETPQEPLPDVYEEGARNTRLFADACAMRRRGFNLEAIEKALLEQNEERCVPPLSEDEIRSIAKSAIRYEPEEALGPGIRGPAQAPTKNLRVITIEDFISAKPEPPPWVVPEWKAARESTLLAGQWGIGKSLIALSLALNQARLQRAEATFLEHLDLPSEAHRVVFIDEENPTPLVQQRVQRLAREMGISEEEHRDMHFYYVSLHGINLDTPAGAATFQRIIDTYEPDEVFLDSLIRFHLRDENSNEQMAKFFALRIQPYITRGLALTAVHHMAKPPQIGDRQVGHLIRGASEIPAFFHEVWALTSEGGHDRTLHQCKNRWGSSPPPLEVFIEETGDEGEPEGLVIRAEEKAREVDRVFWDTLEDQAHAGVLRYEIGRELERSGMSHSAAAKALSRVCKRYKVQGKVRTRREGREVRYWLTRYAPEDAE